MRSVLGLGAAILISSLYMYYLSSYLPPVPRLIKQSRMEADEKPEGVGDTHAHEEGEMIWSDFTHCHSFEHCQ